MKLGSERSSNIERGGGFGMPVIGGGIGAVVIAILALLFRGTPGEIPQTQEPGRAGEASSTAAVDPNEYFVSAVLRDTELTWHDIFRKEVGRDYVEPKLVLFSEGVQSACGISGAATGPFFCPVDQKVSLDTSFFQELRSRFAAPGDFALAYVIAHEVGHHVENQLGIMEEVQNARERSGGRSGNALSVSTELQADCFAGVWANHADKMRHILEQGDVEEGLNAASAIGDDRLQRETRGYVVPESFTHGSSAQRVRWFKRGLQGGRIADCDTFNTPQL
jgi:predicted metalloprotease